jgi:hypothetical protein
MARNQTVVECPAGVWTQLTNADTADISFHVMAGAIEVRATADTTAPAATDRGYLYRNDGQEYHEGELRVDLTAFADDIVPVRLFARPPNGRPARVLVDHG